MDAKNATLIVDNNEERSMLTGIVLLLTGILIALYSPAPCHHCGEHADRTGITYGCERLISPQAPSRG